MKCPQCNSENTRYREARNNHICDNCDHVFSVEQSAKPTRVFISYGHGDEYAQFAYNLADTLMDNGYDVFIDRDGIRCGEQWEINLEDGLIWTSEGDGEGIFLLLMTPYSVRRPNGYCLNEIAYAIDINLKIIPVMLKQVTPPLSIYRLQYLNLVVNTNTGEQINDENITKIIHVLNNPDRLDASGYFNCLDKVLEPIEFNSELKLYKKDFVGREWIFKSIQQWLKDGKQTLVISGIPGIGKSAISTYLYHRMPNVIGFYMFRRNDNEKLSPKRFFATLAFQIASQIPPYREQILKLDIEKIINNYNEVTLFSRLIANPLSACNIESEKIIIIDGLDEAEIDGYNHIAEYLSECIPFFPKEIRIMILARPVSSVMIPFASSDMLPLDSLSEENLIDIKCYIRNAFSEIGTDMLDAIADKSEGSFLYAKYICSQNVLNEVSHLPLGLVSYYFNQFATIFNSKEYEYSRNFLELILGSPRSISPGLIKMVSSCSQYEYNDFIKKMGAYIQINNGMLKIYHSSLSDWLTDEQKAGRFWVDSSRGSRILSEFIGNFIYDKLEYYHDNDDLADDNGRWQEIKKFHEQRIILSRNKESHVEKEIGMKVGNHLFSLYIDLMELNKDWDGLIKFAIWYVTIPYSSYHTLCMIWKILNRNYEFISNRVDYSRLMKSLNMRFTKKVENVMYNTRTGCPSDLTHYMSLLGYDMRYLLDTGFNDGWLEDICKEFRDAFTYSLMMLFQSGYSHEDGICGMFVDEMCDILNRILKSDKIKDPKTINWMRNLAKENESGGFVISTV